MKLEPGTRLEWQVAVLSLCAAVGCLTFGRGPQHGAESEVTVSVVPSDAANLACSGAVGELRCAFDEHEAQVSGLSAPLMPFVSLQNQVVALSGVFESPTIAAWLSAVRGTEPRVSIRCRARVVSPAVRLGFRFRADAPFFKDRDMPAMTVRECEIVH